MGSGDLRSRRRRRAALAAGGLALLCAGILTFTAIPTDTPRRPHAAGRASAAAFHASIGINIHNNYADTAYGQWPRIVRAVRLLGVRHLRDSVKAPNPTVVREQETRLLQLQPLGVRVQLIMDTLTVAEGRVDRLLDFVRERLLAVTDGLEGLNEYDNAGDPEWVEKLRKWQTELHRTAKHDPALADLPVVGPSTISSANRERMGDYSRLADFGNMHPYAGGEPPGGRHLQEELASARGNTGKLPIQATEVGYHDLANVAEGQPGVSERTAAAYVPRIFLEHFATGVPRTYLYELIDEKPDPGGLSQEQHFGLLRDDFSVKPAYVALARLLEVTRDDRGKRGADVAPPKLEGDVDGLRRLDLTKNDGSRVVILWVDGPAFDTKARVERFVASRRLLVRPAAGVGRWVVPLDPERDVPSPKGATGRFRVDVGATPTAVVLGPGSSHGRMPRELAAPYTRVQIP